MSDAKFEPERSLARLEALPARLPPPPRMIRPLLPTKLAGKVPGMCPVSDFTLNQILRAPPFERAHATVLQPSLDELAADAHKHAKGQDHPYLFLLLFYFLAPISLPFAPVACCHHDLFCFRSPPCYSCCR